MKSSKGVSHVARKRVFFPLLVRAFSLVGCFNWKLNITRGDACVLNSEPIHTWSQISKPPDVYGRRNACFKT
ncbi:hypothetical protein BDP55DRAFT_78481 [Colletotrichum godetiae]|uniref:Uncharacterized protein n=1 Tax=Colletotrichum godetiae TaxID=1209918 RepID=A0AAJ0APR6_9PEZI|nr:uncharacterized protein BDP55DRAFT_78481 [Colletotrichum godetiae]KAK1688125.1 hypothetical protein BDP55DRAFT_78481 [Colletotrichum godetiae]